jgi:uncharacterized cupin superfamily protein
MVINSVTRSNARASCSAPLGSIGTIRPGEAPSLGRTDTPGVSHRNIAHWDDVEEHDHAEGSIHSAWRYLGDAAGTVGVGVNRIRVHRGCRSTPLHSHGDDEEIFFVLGGSGLSWQRTERGEDVVCEVGPGTCLVHLATGLAHTLVAGTDGLDVRQSKASSSSKSVSRAMGVPAFQPYALTW